MGDERDPGAGRWPGDARVVLSWMRASGGLLQELVGQEMARADAAGAPDAAIRAHLRFAAAALEACAGEPVAAALSGMRDDLPLWFDETADLLDQHVSVGEGVVALEAHLQFGVLPGVDPAVEESIRRRVRIEGWLRLFLMDLERRLGPGEDGLTESALSWLAAHRRDLGRLIVWLDRQAKAAAERARDAPLDLATQAELGQVAAIQAYVRQLIEAISASISGSTPATDGDPIG